MLYIMRHGRTVWNMEHKLQGKTDVPLSEAGRPVVEQAAAACRDTHIDVCYCSPLIRAMETAEIVLRGREIPIITDVRLEEMGFGICEGTTDFQDNPDNPIYPQLRQGKDILIVGHGAMNASIVCQIKDIPVKDFWSVKMKNAELVRLL